MQLCGELLALRWADVDIAEHSLTVRHALQRIDGQLVLVEPKTERSHRVLTLPPVAIDALRAHRAAQLTERLLAGERWEDRDLVFANRFGRPLDGVTVTHRFQQMLAASGMPRMRFHDLRHACASLLLSEGVNPRVVVEILGHSQISLTPNTYSHVTPQLHAEAAERIERALTAGR